MQMTYLFEIFSLYVQKYRSLPKVDRKMPPLFLYLEIIRYLHATNMLDTDTEKYMDDVMKKCVDANWSNQLSVAEVKFWYANLFPWGFHYLQKKSKSHYDLVTQFKIGQELTLSDLKEYTQHANERSTDASTKKNEIVVPN